jgi:hypothetical protein
MVSRRAGSMPDPEPFEGDAVRVGTIGTIIFAVAFLALLPFYSRLADDGRGWWLYTCLAGFGIGLLGREYSRRVRNTARGGRARR